MLRNIKLPSAENVTSGGRFTVKLPVGPTYAAAHLLLGGSLTVALITDIEVAINGRPVMRFKSGSDLDAFNRRLGLPAASTNSILTVPFRQNWLEEVEEAELFDLGTARQNADGTQAETIVESVTITGTLGTFTAGTITPRAETSSKVRPLGYIAKVLNFPKTLTVSTGGTETDFDSFPIGYADALFMGAAVVEETAGVITSAKLEANVGGASVEIIQDATVAMLKQAQGAWPHARTAISGYVHLDLIGSGQLLDALPLRNVGDLRARLTATHGSNTTDKSVIYAFIADKLLGA